MENKIDVLKFGFKLSKNTKTGVLFYTKEIDDYIIELMRSGNVFSLSVYDSKHKYEKIIANRYKVETQEELDYLVLKGRIGYLFY